MVLWWKQGMNKIMRVIRFMTVSSQKLRMTSIKTEEDSLWRPQFTGEIWKRSFISSARPTVHTNRVPAKTELFENVL